MKRISPKKAENHFASRSQFLQTCFINGAGYCGILSMLPTQAIFANESSQLYKARYWKSLAEKRVKCGLCPNQCEIDSGGISQCHSRKMKMVYFIR